MSSLLSFIAGCALFVLIGLQLARGFFALALRGRLRELTPAQRDEMRAQNRRVRPVAQTSPPAGPIVLREHRDRAWFSTEWTVGCLFAAALLFDDPGLLWTRWLGYPVAVIALLAALGLGFIAWGEWRERLRADVTGLARVQGQTVMDQIAWHEVARVVLVENRVSTSLTGNTVSRVERSLTLVDAQDRVRLTADWPLKPQDQAERLLDAIPAWAGVDVILERRVNGKEPS